MTTGALETHPSEGESEITGDFGLPEAELLNGNIEQAKLSCIKQALDGGEHILNASDSSAWEFATKDSANPITGNLPTKSPNLISKHLSNVNAPAAFANGSACTQSLEKTA
ncbi:MAG: hypothetical protein EOP04_26990 [Proteobacteria bacterium]|nr:MAG: hypothetical protein EOP04_26990 [Pseudomonadota bacterium]